LTKTIISTDAAPKAIGPYSQAVAAGGFLFVSGQLPINPESGVLSTGSISEQTEQVLRNIQSILRAASSDLEKVLKTTVYLMDMKDFAEFNKVYQNYFPTQSPARATVMVAGLPLGARIEVEAVALVGV
jgi:2-iminobutanoate/2-iminopropanoate deaminase